MLNNRKSLVEAVRLVIESLESRRLLASVSSFVFDASGTDQHLAVTFDGPVIAGSMPSVSAVNLTQFAANVPLQTPTLSAGQTIATYKPIASPVTNGWYESYVHDANATAADDPELTFSVLNTDFNSDGIVNFNDFLILQNNFGQSGKTFADGDANYDHLVNFDDYLALQNSFGQSLPDLPNQPGGVVVGNSAAYALDVGWTANDTEPRDGFKVYRSDDGGATYNLVQTLAEPNARAWQDVGTNDDIGTPLIMGQKYWYRVRAFTTAAGASASVTRAWGIPTDTTTASPFSASVNPSTVAPNEPFTLTLSATASVAPAVTAWKITWQNGQTQTLTGGPNSSNTIQSDWLLTHAYAIPGQHFILIQAQDATGWHDPIGVTVNVTNSPPEVSGTDSYTTSSTSAALSVTGTDDGGAGRLSYRWTVESTPAGGTVNLSRNNSGSARNTTATFNKVGDYLLSVIATDALGLTSDPFGISVTVLQATQYLELSPSSASLDLGDTKQFNAYAYDQFDRQIRASDFTWSADHGTIDSRGLYTASGATSDGTDVVHAALSADPDLSADAFINVRFPAPTGLSASAPNASEVNLSWADNSDGETGFVIERSDDNGATFTPVLTASPNATSYSIAGLLPTTTYLFRTRSICAGNLVSQYSNVASVTTQQYSNSYWKQVATTVVRPLKVPPRSMSPDDFTYFDYSPDVAGEYRVSYFSGGIHWPQSSPDMPTWFGGFFVTQGNQGIAYGGNRFGAGFHSLRELENYVDDPTLPEGMWNHVVRPPTFPNERGYGAGIGNSLIYDGQSDPGLTVALEKEVYNETPPQVSISSSDNSAYEVELGAAEYQDNLLKFTVTRTGSDANGDLDHPLTVKLQPPAGTAKSGDDYTGFQGSVTIPAHQNSVDFTVTAKPDDKAETTETLALCIKAGPDYRLGSLNASGTIHNSPSEVSIEAQGGDIHEGESKAKNDQDKFGFWVRRSSSSQAGSTPLTVNIHYGGNAVIGKDVWGVPNQVKIPAGKTEIFVPIGITEDVVPEWTELFQAKLTPSSNYYTTGSDNDYVSWKILDDDYFYVGTYEAPEASANVTSTPSAGNNGTASSEKISLETVGNEFNVVTSLTDGDWIPWLTGAQTAGGDPATSLYNGVVDAQSTDNDTSSAASLVAPAATIVDPMLHARNLSILEEIKPGFSFEVSQDGEHYLGTDAAGRMSQFNLDLAEVAYKGTHQGFLLKFNDDGSIDKWGGEFVNDPKLIERIRKPYEEMQRELSLQKDKYFQQYNAQTEEDRIKREQFSVACDAVRSLLQSAVAVAPGATTIDIETAVTGHDPFNPEARVTGGSRTLSAMSAGLPLVGVVSKGKKLLSAVEQLKQNWSAGRAFENTVIEALQTIEGDVSIVKNTGKIKVTLKSGKIYKTIPDVVSVSKNTLMEIKRVDGLGSLTKQLEAQILAAKKEKMAYRIILGPNATIQKVAPRIRQFIEENLARDRAAIVKYDPTTRKLVHLWP